MASEKNVSKIIKELGFEPKEHACIVVKYAPDDSLGSKLSNFFTLEYYIMHLCPPNDLWCRCVSEERNCIANPL